MKSPLELLDLYDIDEKRNPRLKYPKSPLLEHLPYGRAEQQGKTRRQPGYFSIVIREAVTGR
jgi:hypothetical protein